MSSSIAHILSETYNARSVIRQLVIQQLILRYRRTLLGYVWTLVSPLLMMSVMAVVFATLMKSDLNDFVVFLFAAMIPWNFFSAVTTQSGGCFINNEGLIKKIYIPKMVFPVSLTIALLIDSILSFLALFVIMLTVGAKITPALFFVVISYCLLAAFAFGAGLVMSVATVFFRDLQHVTLIAMQGLFFLSPILYKVDALNGKIGMLVELNPIVPFIELFRLPLYYGTIPPLQTVISALLLAIVSLSVGLFAFMKNQKKIVFRL